MYISNKCNLVTKHPIIYRCISEIYYAFQSILIDTKNKFLPNKILKKYTNTIIYHLLSNGCCFVNIKNKTVVEYDYYKLEDKIHTFTHKNKTFKHSLDNIHTIHLDYLTFNPLQTAMKHLEILTLIDEYTLHHVKNGGRPAGIFSIPQFTSDEQKNKIKHSIHSVLQNVGNKGSAAVVEGEYQWQNIGLGPREIQILDIKNALCKMICMCFHIPPILMGFEDRTYTSNYEASYKRFITGFIEPLMYNINNELNKI